MLKPWKQCLGYKFLKHHVNVSELCLSAIQLFQIILCLLEVLLLLGAAYIYLRNDDLRGLGVRLSTMILEVTGTKLNMRSKFYWWNFVIYEINFPTLSRMFQKSVLTHELVSRVNVSVGSSPATGKVETHWETKLSTWVFLKHVFSISETCKLFIQNNCCYYLGVFFAPLFSQIHQFVYIIIIN